MSKNKSKSGKLKKGKTLFIKQPEETKQINETDISRLASIDYPIFSFKYLSEVSFTDHGDLQFFRDFLIRLKKLANSNWNLINISDRHGIGTEKIKRENIRPEIPNELTPDIKFLAFRSNGDNRSMVGFRMWNIFYIVFIEAKHNDIYDHK